MSNEGKLPSSLSGGEREIRKSGSGGLCKCGTEENLGAEAATWWWRCRTDRALAAMAEGSIPEARRPAEWAEVNKHHWRQVVNAP